MYQFHIPVIRLGSAERRKQIRTYALAWALSLSVSVRISLIFNLNATPTLTPTPETLQPLLSPNPNTLILREKKETGTCPYFGVGVVRVKIRIIMSGLRFGFRGEG
jgi:hypothetical protein